MLLSRRTLGLRTRFVSHLRAREEGDDATALRTWRLPHDAAFRSVALGTVCPWGRAADAKRAAQRSAGAVTGQAQDGVRGAFLTRHGSYMGRRLKEDTWATGWRGSSWGKCHSYTWRSLWIDSILRKWFPVPMRRRIPTHEGRFQLATLQIWSSSTVLNPAAPSSIFTLGYLGLDCRHFSVGILIIAAMAHASAMYLVAALFRASQKSGHAKLSE